MDVRSMLTRVIDFLKSRGTTAMFTSLTSSEQSLEHTETLISSLMDTWILVAAQLEGRHRHRHIYVLKSRGMPHSDEVRNFRFTSHGIDIEPAQGNDTARAEKPRRAAGTRARAGRRK
jgi:circadian clock protein KaiC